MTRLDNAHALVIGIAEYQNIRRLPRVKDAEDVTAVLTSPDSCGYPPENVRLLLDGQATREAVGGGLAELARKTNADSTVFLYFSGHGGRVESGPAAGQYLLPVDTVYPGDEDLARTAVSGQEFTAALRALPARKVMVVFDCCHAGGIGEPRQLSSVPVRPGLGEDVYAQALASGQGRVIVASSLPEETSIVEAGADYGLFTQHLLDGLRGGVASEDGFVRIFDLFEYLQPRVTRANPRQHPLFKAELRENFPVALYRGGQKGTVARDAEGYRYDAYVSYADTGADAEWVWRTLLPRLEKEGLRVAVSGDVQEGGVDRVVGVERGVTQAKRTVVVLSDDYLAGPMQSFENVLGVTLGLQEGTYRVLPVRKGPLDERRLPLRLSGLVTRDLAHPHRAEREFANLIRDLKGPLPRR